MAAKEKSTPKGRTKTTPRNYPPAVVEDALFDRVVGILEQARSNVVRAVNGQMVLAYWLIGREIVQEIQGGKKRADYGRQVLADLSMKLTERYGAGFSKTNLRHFRAFYFAYANRFMGIQRTLCAESSRDGIQHPLGAELAVPEQGRTPRDLWNEPDPTSAIQHTMCAESLPPSLICYPAGSESLSGFSPQLSWSHYRALMRVEKPEARDFYEREASDGSWDVRTLERQIHSFYYERLLKSQQPPHLLVLLGAPEVDGNAALDEQLTLALPVREVNTTLQ